MKTCSKCGAVKELGEFHTRKTASDGRMSQCKECRREYYAAAPDKVKARSAKWRKDNPERYAELCKARSKRNSENEKIRHAVRYSQKSDEFKARSAKWRKDNPERYKERQRLVSENMTPCYIAQRVGVSVKDITPELIELKREQLLMHRATKQLTKEIENGTK